VTYRISQVVLRIIIFFYFSERLLFGDKISSQIRHEIRTPESINTIFVAV
jgi:uncharacterized membrane protein